MTAAVAILGRVGIFNANEFSLGVRGWWNSTLILVNIKISNEVMSIKIK
jgi:hypothetical protein